MTRPTITAGAFATLAGQVPSRVSKRLDANPKLAEGWTWTDGSVTTDNGEVVTWRVSAGHISDATAVTCSCLLSPKCLHVLAVTSLFDIAGETTAPAPAPVVDTAPARALTPEQRAAARHAFLTGADLLQAGAASAGSVLQAELLRAVHTCRLAGLPRLAACGVRIVQGIRELRSDQAEFVRADFTREIFDWLFVSAALSQSTEPPPNLDSLIGIGRREYQHAGHLKLWGLLTEPVIARTGHAGASTVLTDGQTFFSLGDVQPGGEERVLSAYRGGAKLGGGAITHEWLGRGTLLVQGATVSADGRLGAGAQVKAVAGSVAGWQQPEVSALFAKPVEQQLERALGEATLPVEQQNAGALLVFLEGRVEGLARTGLRVELLTGQRLTLRAAALRTSLPYLENLELLARAPGLAIRLAARVTKLRGTVELLAVGPANLPDAPTLLLPDTWSGLCNVGLDRLQRSHLSQSAESPRRLEEPVAPNDPLRALRHRLERLAVGGTGTLPSSVLPAVEEDSRRLERALMPRAATLLRLVGRLAQRDATKEQLARAFAATALHLTTAAQQLEREQWFR